MKTSGKGLRISFNSPVVLSFTLICLASLGLGYLTNGASTKLLFSVCRSSLLDPLTYLRFIGHVFGHADLNHFMSNIMLLLVVGPMLEEKYGSANLIFVILATALLTGLVNFIFFPHVRLMGASGVVFAFILLSSFVSFRDGTIPLTFILVAVLYIGREVYSMVTVRDNVSQLCHILGGGVGSGLGFVMAKEKMSRY